MVKNLPAVPEIRVQSLLGRSSQEGNGNPPQYSCLEILGTEEPWATVHGVAQEKDMT